MDDERAARLPTAGDALPVVAAVADRLGWPLDAARHDRLAAYRALVLDWNQRQNLTGTRAPADFERAHLVDALSLLLAVPPAELARARLVDIGTGAGLPGLPLRILVPGLRLTLIEATGKKVAFLRAAVAALGLRDVTIEHGRAEELAHRPALRARFDLVTARAVAELPTLIELGLPFLRSGGRLLAPKKAAIDAELAAARRALLLLGGVIERRVTVDWPELDARQIVVIAKRRPTPTAYPRRAGLPAHQPLV